MMVESGGRTKNESINIKRRVFFLQCDLPDCPGLCLELGSLELYCWTDGSTDENNLSTNYTQQLTLLCARLSPLSNLNISTRD